MHYTRSTIALAFFAGALQAQQPVQKSRTDSISVVGVSDSLDFARLSRREAIALALAHNPQLEIARAR